MPSNHLRRSGQPPRQSAASRNRASGLQRGGIGFLGLDSGNQTDALNECTPASPGAGDLTLLQAEARGGARVLAINALGACVMIAILFAWAVWG